MADQPTLFDAPTATEVGLAARDRAASRHTAEIAQLVPIAVELARKAGAHGVTVADVRLTAVQRGILTGQERGRQLSWLSAVMPAAGLVNTGRYRRSHLIASHGNLQATWVLPEHAEAAA